MDKTTKYPHVVIVGAGFGGLRAARALDGAPVQVTLLDRNNYHLFQPLLYQVATAGLSPDQIVQPVRAMLSRQKNLAFRMADVLSANLDKQTLHTSLGDIRYDYLLLAVGSATNYFNLEQLPKHAYSLKSIQDAEQIRNHLLNLCEEALFEKDATRLQAMLTFVVAGGGPSGVESAGAIAELVRNVLPRDYPSLDLSLARVFLMEAADRLLPAMPSDLAAYSVRSLEQLGVEVCLRSAVNEYDGNTIHLASGGTLAAETLVWAAGAKPALLIEQMQVEKARQGRVVISPTLQLPGHLEVFVIGDAAHLPGKDGAPLPMIAPVAMQQGAFAARNLLRMIEGKPLREFTYRDPGLMATIGRSRAVARIGPFKLRGLFAWLAWVVVHIFQLIGFRNRLLVLVDWAWNYLLYDRPVRMIDRAPRRQAQALHLAETE